MRIGASAALLLVTVAGSGNAAVPTFTLELPSGPLSSAISVLAAKTGASIGSPEPALLARILPMVHARGSVADLVDLLAKRAGLRAKPLGGDRWIILRAPVARSAAPARIADADDHPIVVEAAKQAEHLADLPAELIQISGAGLAADGGDADTRALAARIPSLASTDWGAGNDKLFLRGIADSSFTGASPALVGQYWEDMRLTFSAPDPDLRLYDVASVELLEGPQGTLYGAGALGGLIRVQPNPPSLSRTEGWIAAGVAPTAHGGTGGDAEAMLNLPLADDRLGLRVVGYDATEAGYIDNSYSGSANVNRTRTYGGRATLRWRVAGDWTVDFGAIGQRIRNRDTPYADADAPPLTRSSRFPQPSHNNLLSGRVVIGGTLGGATLRSTTGIVEQSFGERYEVLQPFNSLLYDGRDRSRLISHETRLSGRSASRNWVIGFGLLSNMDLEDRSYGRGATPPPLATIDNHAREIVGYGELTQSLLPGLSATAGVRVSSDHDAATATDLASPFVSLLRVPTPAPTHISNSQWTALPSAALLYRPGDAITLFLRYGSGYRPGGLAAGDTVEQFRGDRLDSLEAGIRRGTPGSDRFTFALTAVSTRWRHIQADLLDGIGLPYVANIGNGVVDSLDGNVGLRIGAGWQIDAAGLLTHNRLHPNATLAANGDASRLPNVVHESFAVSLDHSATLFGRPWHEDIRLQHIGRSLFGIGPQLAVPQGDYTTLAMGTTLRLDRIDLQFDATNLLDSRHNAFAAGTPFAGLVSQQITPLRPRTLRIGCRYDF